MTKLINRSWEEDVLINDAFREEFSLKNLLTFQAENSSHVVESENQTSTGSQSELVNQHKPPDQLGENLGNFLYPSVSPFPSFLLPPERPINEKNDTSHIPIVQLASLEEEVERNLSEVSRKVKTPCHMEKVLASKLITLIPSLPLKLILTKFFEIFGLWGKQLKK